MDIKNLKLYKFYADWCGPCKVQTKMFGETPLKVEIVSVNVEEDSELVDKFGIRGVPTLILADDEDTIIKSWNKLTNPNVINEFIDELRLQGRDSQD